MKLIEVLNKANDSVLIRKYGFVDAILSIKEGIEYEEIFTEQFLNQKVEYIEVVNNHLMLAIRSDE